MIRITGGRRDLTRFQLTGEEVLSPLDFGDMPPSSIRVLLDTDYIIKA